MARVNDINITDGIIAYRNFSGRPTDFKPEGGVRTVTFVIPDNIAEDLIKDGWNIRLQMPKNEDGDPRYLLECKITFRTRNGTPRDPKIFIVRDDGIVHVTEETIDTLDRADIVHVDAVIGPSYWEWGGRSGIAAYVNSMYLTIKENAIDEKYRKMIEEMNNSILPTDNDLDLPFPVE
jgi:hypothetical protein